MKGSKKLSRQLEAYSATSKSVAARLSWRDRLGNWPTYCAATAAALASATSASAGIIYSGPVNRTVSVATNSFPTCGCGVTAGIPVKSLLGASFKLGVGHGSYSGIHTGYAGIYFPRVVGHPGLPQGGVFTNGYGSIQKFNVGSMIAPGSYNVHGALAAKSYGGPWGQWQGARTVTGFAGAMFFAGIQTFNTSQGGTHKAALYDTGWLRLRVQDLNGDQIPDVLTLLDYAYDSTPFNTILAGQTQSPEPSEASMMLLAAGAAGVVAWKRRRKQAV